ncbi:MAG TPA: class I SAM-dependent methyltransferase [Burkholderiales bacterium]|nr:class I SAM-dependent methyltransferase [Burkholderiales bacterium]
MSNHDTARAAAEWLTTPLGQYLLAREQAYFDRTAADIFGYIALQLGLPQIDLLRANRIACRLHADPSGPAELRADFRDLPVASNSIDLVVLAHVLEFSENPHQVLREVARVLLPEGQMVIACFNPWSLWGFRRVFGKKVDYPWNGRFINLPRLKDWLTLLELEITGGQMCCYSPPCATEKWLQRFAFMEAAGDRWWPITGGIYFLQAVKRVRGMRLIMPRWSDRLAPKKDLAPVPKKVARPDEAVVARNGVSDKTSQMVRPR